jgi:hypothetical protein
MKDLPTVPARFVQYVDYINNTALEPLPLECFDEDWDPIGQTIRDELKKHEIIQVRNGGIYLRPDLVKRKA